MSETFFPALFVFRPTDKDLSPEERAKIQIHRLLSVLGAQFVPLFGPLYATYNPEAVDPYWARFGLSGLFLALLLASYGIKAVRRHYILLLRGLLYVLCTWFLVITALNRFTGNYAVGLLLVYAVLTVVLGLGVQTTRPVFWFTGTGFLLTAGSGFVVATPQTRLPILLLCMATVAIVGSIVIQTQLSILQELRAAKEEAEEASRLRTAMLANMGHEVRTPLTSINGHAQILVDELNGQLRTFARGIYESGQILMNTLNSVLDFSQLEAGVYAPERKPIRLDKRIETIAEQFRSMAKTKSIELRTDIGPL